MTPVVEVSESAYHHRTWTSPQPPPDRLHGLDQAHEVSPEVDQLQGPHTTNAQFLTRDPLEAVTQSAYGYVDGDPLDGVDPSGLCSLFSWGGDGCIAQAAAAVPGGDSLDNALTSFVRFGDEATFGASHWVRHQIGLGDAVDECSSAYNSQVAVAASMVFMLADGEGEALAPERGITYTEKVLKQIESGDDHALPAVIDKLVRSSDGVLEQGGDGRWYTHYRLGGAKNGVSGV